MTMGSRLAGALVTLALCASFGAPAHHSGASYDLRDGEFAVQGIIKSVSFRNPHSRLLLLRSEADGSVREWDIEFGGVNQLQRRGWQFARVRAGDVVTCTGTPDRTGAPKLYMWSLRLADGTEFGK
jgi:hypothetical protein